MATRMILTGDVNLMNVTDPAVPFALVKDEFRATEIVFCNLECCLYQPPTAHSLEREGFFADPEVAGEALRSGGDHGVDRAPRSARDCTYRGGCEPGAGARPGDPRAERNAAWLSAAQLGLLADQSRGERGGRRHCCHPRSYRLPSADAPQRAAGEPPGYSARNHNLGRPCLSPLARGGHRSTARAGGSRRRLVPLGTAPGCPPIHDGNRPPG